MQVKKEILKQSKVKLTIEVTPKELAGYFRTVYEAMASDVKIDGFRAGKAPYKMIEGVVGYNKLLGNGLDEALNKTYQLAVAKEKLFPVSSPKVEIKKSPQFSLDETEILDNLVFEIEVDVMPEVELEDYSKAKVTSPKKQEASEKEVDKIIEQLRKQKATFKEREGKIVKGDRIEINFEGSSKGVRRDNMCSKNHPMILGEGNMIPGFEDEIIGMKKGENKEFKIKFPKDYHDKELAGNEAVFKVTLNDAKEVVLPELNNEFAKIFGHPTMEKLLKEVKKSLEVEVEKEYKEKLEANVLDEMSKYIKVELPEGLIEQEIDRMLEGYRKQIEGYGVNFEKYLENAKKTPVDIRKDMRSGAEKNVKVGLMLGKVIEEQKIDHHDQDAGRKALDFLVKTLTKK